MYYKQYKLIVSYKMDTYASIYVNGILDQRKSLVCTCSFPLIFLNQVHHYNKLSLIVYKHMMELDNHSIFVLHWFTTSDASNASFIVFGFGSSQNNMSQSHSTETSHQVNNVLITFWIYETWALINSRWTGTVGLMYEIKKFSAVRPITWSVNNLSTLNLKFMIK